MRYQQKRLSNRQYSPEDLARFDTGEMIRNGNAAFTHNGSEVHGSESLITGMAREHKVMPGLSAVIMDGSILGEYITNTDIPPGLMIYAGFKANGHTNYGKISLPHQTLPNLLFLYTPRAIAVEQKTFVGPYRTIVIHFAEEQFQQMLSEHCVSKSERKLILDGLENYGPCHYWRPGADLMEQLNSLIYTELTGVNLNLFVNQNVLGILRAVLGYISEPSTYRTRSGKGQLSASDINAVETAAQYIEDNLNAKLTLSNVAAEIGVSGQFLKLNFPRIYGDSVAYYVLKVRMNHARIMLMSGGMTIQQVAAQVGYASQASFTTAFRKYHSMTPREAYNACM